MFSAHYRYNETGLIETDVCSRATTVASSHVVALISKYLSEKATISALEIRDRLLKDNICNDDITLGFSAFDRYLC